MITTRCDIRYVSTNLSSSTESKRAYWRLRLISRISRKLFLIRIGHDWTDGRKSILSSKLLHCKINWGTSLTKYRAGLPANIVTQFIVPVQSTYTFTFCRCSYWVDPHYLRDGTPFSGELRRLCVAVSCVECWVLSVVVGSFVCSIIT